MTEKRYEAIICDLGNVLIDFDHNIAVRKLLKYTPKKEKDIYNLFFDSPFTKLYEEGKVSSEEFFKRVKDALSLNIDYNTFFLIWNNIFFETPANIKMHDFLRSIKSRYKLVLVSNLNKTHFEFLRERMGILKEFDKLLLSYEVGARKPAPEIYKKALESVNTPISKALYIDDRKDLIEKAGKLGLKGIVFKDEASIDEIRKEIRGCQAI